MSFSRARFPLPVEGWTIACRLACGRDSVSSSRSRFLVLSGSESLHPIVSTRLTLRWSSVSVRLRLFWPTMLALLLVVSSAGVLRPVP